LNGPQLEAWFQLTRRALLDALNGWNPRQLPLLDLSAGSGFQRRVWQVLLEIPAGQTRTYKEIADHLRPPAVARAVGGGCGANPIPVLVPCHRVIATDRRLGGFSGGLEWKARLLEREGAWPLAKRNAQAELALA
jgi:O-6-methylguanine DNA methyltransferase